MDCGVAGVPERLKAMILKEGKVLPNGILKVDSFVNHQIYPALHMDIGRYLSDPFLGLGINKVLTLESSGIAPAFATALTLGVPMVFATKKKPITMQEYWHESAPSHTKSGVVDIYVSKEVLSDRNVVLIVDDFLATGLSILALARIVQASGAKLAGIATVIEKTFEGGRELLMKSHQTHIHSAVRISRLSESAISFE